MAEEVEIKIEGGKVKITDESGQELFSGSIEEVQAWLRERGFGTWLAGMLGRALELGARATTPICMK